MQAGGASTPIATSRSGRAHPIPYDILKEAFVAFLAVAVLIVLLAVVFSSPGRACRHTEDLVRDRPGRLCANSSDRVGRVERHRNIRAALQRHPDAAQHIGFFEPAQWLGVHLPVDTAQDFVLGPLRTLPNQPVTQQAITAYQRPLHGPAEWHGLRHTRKAVANAANVKGRLARPTGALSDPLGPSSVP